MSMESSGTDLDGGDGDEAVKSTISPRMRDQMKRYMARHMTATAPSSDNGER